jgi:hypothetical protein
MNGESHKVAIDHISALNQESMDKHLTLSVAPLPCPLMSLVLHHRTNIPTR